MRFVSPLAAIALLLSGINSNAETGRESIDKSLLLWLPLETDFTDASPRSNPTATRGNVRIVPGQGAVFDGEGDAIGLEGLDLKDKSFSIAFWMKLTGNNGSYGIFQQRSGKNRREWLHFLLREPDKLYLGFYGADTKSRTSIRKSDRWRHIVCAYHEGKASIWLDGKLDTSESKPSFLGDQGQFVIGLTPGWSNVNSSDFEGCLRDFRVYQRALSEFEISVMAAARK